MDKAHASRISYGRSQCESQSEHTRDAVPRYTASYGSPQCESQCEYASDEVRSSQSSYGSYKRIYTLPHPIITSVHSKGPIRLTSEAEEYRSAPVPCLMWARRDDSLRRVAVLGYSDIDLALHRLPGLLAPLQRHEAGSGRRGARVGDLTYLAVVWWAGVVISLILYGFSVPLTHLLDASNQYNDIGFFNENEMPINGLSSTRLLADGWLNSWVRLLAGLDKLTKTAPLAIIAIFATLSVVLDVVVRDTLNVNEYILLFDFCTGLRT